jgi:hypothetical protein
MANKRIVFCITITTTDGYLISLSSATILRLGPERKKICTLYTQFFSIVKSLTFAGERCSYRIWESNSTANNVMASVTTAKQV